jgi:hypothetical protein
MNTMNPNNVITNFLITEHALFCELFDEIDRLLPGVRTAAEVRLLSRLVEGVLSRHADHVEIDACLHHATVAAEFVEAVRFLRAGLKASREHFRREEETVFPLFEKLFDPAALEALGGGASGSASPLWPHGFENALRGRLWNPEYCYQSACAAFIASHW